MLDLTVGAPARGLTLELWRLDGAAAERLKTVVTNDDGRIEGALLEGEAFKAGTYELRFMAGDYRRRVGEPSAEPPFLDVVPVRFGVADPQGHYHVPLLLSAYGYSTYRGS